MNLVRDVLDKKIVDRRHRPVGRVDGIVLGLRAGQPPRVVALECGLGTRARRLHGRLGDWAEALERRLGVSDGRPTRVACRDVSSIGIEVRLDLDVTDTAALCWEHWLYRHFLRFLPGGRR